MVVCGGGASELRCAAFSCDLRAGSHDASAVDSYTTPIPKTARFLEIGVFASARAPGLRLVGKLG